MAVARAVLVETRKIGSGSDADAYATARFRTYSSFRGTPRSEFVTRALISQTHSHNRCDNAVDSCGERKKNLAPEKWFRQKIVPEKMVPEKMVPENGLPENTVTEKMAPENRVPVPKNVSLKNILTETLVPEKMVPNKVVLLPRYHFPRCCV